MTEEQNKLAEWLDSQDFYELCQQYRHAQDPLPRAPGLLTAAQAYEELKRQIILRAKNEPATLDEQMRSFKQGFRNAIEMAAQKCESEECLFSAGLIRSLVEISPEAPEREPATEAVLDSKMADLLVDATWRKCVGQCIANNCGRLFISRERFDEHIAPLIRALKGKGASQGAKGDKCSK